MRRFFRILALLTIAALLAPGVRWVSLGGYSEACACPPDACMCAYHQHLLGHTPTCCMSKGGSCGMGSHDSTLTSLVNTFIYLPAEHHWSIPLPPRIFGAETSDLNLLPSHVRIPEQPPRATL